MPTYEYRCTGCDHRFEVTRPMGSTEETLCPSCESPGKRVFSPVGVAFKGSGFHNTDYRERPKDAAPACEAKKPGDACANCPSAAS